jgi:hypothetical protein
MHRSRAHLFLISLLTGFREQEVVNLMWDEIMFQFGLVGVAR